MLVSKEPVRVEVPHEEGAWFDLLKLSWVQIKKARKAATLDSAETAKAFGAELMKALGSDDKGEEKALRLIKTQQYDESMFDTELLLLAGVSGWSYDEAVSEETVKLLDEETATWVKQAIIDLTKPPSEEDQKKDSDSSGER